MTDTPKDGQDERMANVIVLSVARNRYMPGCCRHLNITIDEDLFEVKCDDCGEKINPVSMLARFCNEQSMWEREGQQVKTLLAKLDERTRCKCQHCGRITRITP